MVVNSTRLKYVNRAVGLCKKNDKCFLNCARKRVEYAS